jgi:hypothetical protein
LGREYKKCRGASEVIKSFSSKVNAAPVNLYPAWRSTYLSKQTKLSTFNSKTVLYAAKKHETLAEFLNIKYEYR